MMTRDVQDPSFRVVYVQEHTRTKGKLANSQWTLSTRCVNANSILSKLIRLFSIQRILRVSRTLLFFEKLT